MTLDPELVDAAQTPAASTPETSAALAAFNALPALDQMRERLRMSVQLGARGFYPYVAPEAKVEWLTRCVSATLANGRSVMGVLYGVEYSVMRNEAFISFMTAMDGDLPDFEVETLFASEIVALYPPRPDQQLLAFTGRAPRERKVKADGSTGRVAKPRGPAGPKIARTIDLNAMFGGTSVDMNALTALLNKHRASLVTDSAPQIAAADEADDPYADDPEVAAMRAQQDAHRAAAFDQQTALALAMREDADIAETPEPLAFDGEEDVTNPGDAPIIYETDEAAADAAFGDVELVTPEAVNDFDGVTYEYDPDVAQAPATVATAKSGKATSRKRGK